MLTKKRQKKHFDQAWKAMLEHLQNYYASLDPEDLHRFRVKAKKAQALLRYLHSGSRRKTVENTYQPVRNIFKQAGEIRSIQVHLVLLEEAGCTNLVFIRQQKRALRAATKLFCAQPAFYLESIRTVCQTLNGHFHDIKKKRLARLFDKKIDNLGRSFADSEGSTSRWHSNRKTIKQLLFLHECLPGPIRRTIPLHTVYLEQLAETIGQWHDVEMTLDLLPDAGGIQASSLDQLNRQHRQLKKDIRAHLSRFEQQARQG